MFYALMFLGLTFFNQDAQFFILDAWDSFFHLLYSGGEYFLFKFLNFSFPVLSQFEEFSCFVLFCFSFLLPCLMPWTVLISFQICMCFPRFNYRLILTLIKVHEHIHNCYFEVLVLYLTYITFLSVFGSSNGYILSLL